MLLSELAKAISARHSITGSALDAWMDDLRQTGVKDGPALQAAFDNWRGSWKYQRPPRPAEFREHYEKPAVKDETPKAYMPSTDRLRAAFHAVDDEFKAYLLKNFGHADATHVFVNGVKMGAQLHPLNEWMQWLRGVYHKKIERVAYCTVAWDDGRCAKEDLDAARRQLQLTTRDVEKAKYVFSKTPTVNPSPFKIDLPQNATAGP